MDLTLFNSLTRSLEPFVPIGPGPVGIYTCGPTVYARQHIGNLRAYVFADLLGRALRWFGHATRHVINITDVGHLTSDADSGDDKIERAARESAGSALGLAEHWTRLFQRDLALLGVAPPDVWAKASAHIAEQIEMIARLETKGLTYRLRDGIYFDTARDPDYGAFERLAASARHSRVAIGGEKRSAADFALWKLSPAAGPRRQLEWPSPWGVGFPGWHIECSAMATKYLGSQFEIHTGGVDHVAVHHTNEIAQSENALGVRPWVKYWLHGGWLLLDGEKLSKSRGASLSLDDLIARGVPPAAYRYYLLTAHYRAPLAFSLDALESAQAGFERLKTLASRAGAALDLPAGAPAQRARFRAALADDLDTPLALATLWDIARDSSLPEPLRGRLVAELGGVLGLEFGAAGAEEPELDADVARLVDERERARRQRDFERADAIRSELSARGIAVDDTPAGPRPRRA